MAADSGDGFDCVDRFDCVVIGGGISGLAAALRLVTSSAPGVPKRLALLEAGSRVGGCLQTERRHDCLLEAGPDSFLSRKPGGVGMCVELGLAGELIGRKGAHRGALVRRGDALHPLPEGMSGLIPLDESAVANAELLSEAGRRRFAAEVEVAERPRGRHEDDEDDESVAAFVRRRFGDEAFDYLVEPLLAGIYAGDASRMSLAATFPQLQQAEREAGSVLRGLRQVGAAPAAATGAAAASAAGGAYLHPPGPFLSLRDGMQSLVDAAAARLAAGQLEQSCQIRTSSEVTDLHRVDDAWRVHTTERTVQAATVVLATPAAICGRLLRRSSATAAAAASAIPAASTALVSCALPIDAARFRYGWLVPAREHRDVVAVSVSSNKWTGRAPEGTALFRVFLGRWPSDDPAAGRGEWALEEEAVAELRRAGIGESPDWLQVHRWPSAIPQYVLGHSERLATLRGEVAKLPGIEVAGPYLEGVGIPDCIASGERAAEAVIAYRGHKPR